MSTVEIIEITEGGPYDFTWWVGGGTEHFDRSWVGEAVLDGRRAKFRHGVGSRFVYGKQRVHSVTWLDGQPIVEGVAADDYALSRCLLSPVRRPDKRLARSAEEVPASLRQLPLVDHRSELDAAYSRRAIAVKIPDDNVEGWLTLAASRLHGRPGAAGTRVTPRLGKRVPAKGESGPSLGLIVRTELERGIPPEEFMRYLKRYEQETGYDSSLRALEEAVAAEGADLEREDHRTLVLRWLRSWGCRHLARASEERSSTALLDWYRRFSHLLSPPDRSLVDLEPDSLTAAAIAFGTLSDWPASSRQRKSAPVPVRFGPTAAAKTLFAIRPNAFPPWDEPIRKELGYGQNDAAYRAYLEDVDTFLNVLADRVGVPVEELPTRLGRARSSPPKLIDEYLWVRISRRWMPA